MSRPVPKSEEGMMNYHLQKVDFQSISEPFTPSSTLGPVSNPQKAFIEPMVTSSLSNLTASMQKHLCLDEEINLGSDDIYEGDADCCVAAVDAPGSRQLKRSESDSFKRLINFSMMNTAANEGAAAGSDEGSSTRAKACANTTGASVGGVTAEMRFCNMIDDCNEENVLAQAAVGMSDPALLTSSDSFHRLFDTHSVNPNLKIASNECMQTGAELASLFDTSFSVDFQDMSTIPWL